MTKQHQTRHQADRAPTLDSSHSPATGLTSQGDGVAPIRETVRSWALEALIAAYGGNTYRLLTDLADRVEATLAYVDRSTVEAHLERPLSAGEWSLVAAQFSAMAFDEHVGDAGTVRTDWIEDRLLRAGVAGRALTAAGSSWPSRSSRRR
jgi:hypothetical protein